jgi:hypothetical protein
MLAKAGQVCSRALLHSQSDAHGSGYANGRRSADRHVTNGRGYFFVALANFVNFFGGKASLVNEANTFIGPFNGFDHYLDFI